MLVTIIFSFSYNVFYSSQKKKKKKLYLKGYDNARLFGKGLESDNNKTGFNCQLQKATCI